MKLNKIFYLLKVEMVKQNGFLEKFIKLIDHIQSHKFVEVDDRIIVFLQISEYITYIVACLLIVGSFIYTGKQVYIFYRFKSKKASILMNIRFIFGQILTLALTFILAGHVIKLIHTSSIRTVFLLIILILIREFMTSNLDKETKNLFKTYHEQIQMENEQKKYL